MKYRVVINKLLNSENPSIKWKTLVNILGEDPNSKKIKKLEELIKQSSTIRSLLSNMSDTGKITSFRNVYDKWQGAHWVLASLADIGYPKNDESLYQAKEQVLSHWLSPYYYKEFEAKTKTDAYKKEGVPIMEGRYRRCASQQGYALYYLIKLGLVDERIHHLAERLLHWQWPDGGWNCDKNPKATKSTFIHTAISMRGLGIYGKEYEQKEAEDAAKKAVEVLLKRKLYKKQSDDTIIKEEFTLLHYPLYWHYDILGGLKIIAELGQVQDPRCTEAIELLISKYIKDEGWPAESKYYKTSNELKLGNDYVNWGGTSKKKMNEWVTVDALYVLKEAGFLN